MKGSRKRSLLPTLGWVNFVSKSVSACAILVGVFIYGAPAHAQVAVERIERFDTTVVLKTDATAQVIEKIRYQFIDETHHGIYRYIPISYMAGTGNKSIGITNVSIVDEKGVPYIFSTSKNGKNLRFQIGNPNAYATGTKMYIISYTVSRAVSYFKTYDEWYWNITGVGWTVPIEEASTIVTLPASLLKENIYVHCYEGDLRSTKPCLTESTYEEKETTSSIKFSSGMVYAPGQGLTVAVGFPKGTVMQPTLLQSAIAYIKDNWIVSLPAVTFALMYVLWYYKGRDPKGRGTIVPEYDSPDNLMPIQQYALQYERVSNQSVSAEIISLAIRGYLKITKLNEKGLIFSHSEYVLDKKKDGEDLLDFDRALLDGIFVKGPSVKLSDLKNTFYAALPNIKKLTISSLVSKKYFSRDPATIRNIYLGAGVALVFVVFIFGSLLTIVDIVSAIASSATIILFGLKMPKATKEGVVVREKILGLKMYMDVAEKDRINFHNAPEKNPELFEKLLPFAMVLGVEKVWAKQFEGIYTKSSSWYNDTAGRAFSPVFFIQDMDSFSSTLASALGGSSGSGGGGSSGGGFGGGGGGSW